MPSRAPPFQIGNQFGDGVGQQIEFGFGGLQALLEGLLLLDLFGHLFLHVFGQYLFGRRLLRRREFRCRGFRSGRRQGEPFHQQVELSLHLLAQHLFAFQHLNQAVDAVVELFVFPAQAVDHPAGEMAAGGSGLSGLFGDLNGRLFRLFDLRLRPRWPRGFQGTLQLRTNGRRLAMARSSPGAGGWQAADVTAAGRP